MSKENLNTVSSQTAVKRSSFKWYSTEDLIDCLPQNRPLYKDSGLWQIRTDDMENTFIEQNTNETLRGFILRYLDWLKEIDKQAIEEMYIDLSRYNLLS